ncbi:MAG: hypothetical protein RLZZ58_2120 [Pseudomonadota bacterium]
MVGVCRHSAALAGCRGTHLPEIKFDMGAAWNDGVALTRMHRPLVATLAGVFLFLPQLAVGLLGPGDPAIAPGATIDQIIAAFTAWANAMLPYLLVLTVISAFASQAILKLWLAPPGISVGEAMSTALTLLVTAVIASVLGTIAIYLGFLALIVPGLYLLGRLAFAQVAIADREIRNPIAALQASWDLTRGNGWRIVGFLFLIAIVIGILLLLAGMVIGGLVGLVLGSAAPVVLAVLEAAANSIIGVLMLAIYVAIYRQLSGVGREGIFA